MALKTRVGVVTLGCPKNTVDSEFLLGQLCKSEVEIVQCAEDADTVIINTCGFIQDAKKESIDTIMQAVNRKNHGELKKIVVMGCLSERFQQDLAKEIPEVDAFFGTNQLREVLSNLGIDYKSELIGERYLTTPSHYAYLKISEGCDNPCSFCAIPLMRGVHRSRPINEIVSEASFLAGKGVKELIVIAQDTTCYGLDLYSERQIGKLLGELNKIDGIEWIRLMYTNPASFPLDIIESFNKYEKMCRYIDIPIQHCADSVLRSMRRGITQRATRELLIRLKNEIPELGIRTTLLVGYPNETEEDFEELYDFVENMRFDRLGIFEYSQEEGTASFELGDPVPADIKRERKARIMQLQMDISEQNNETLIGKKIKVIVDRKDGETFIGRTEWDAPEIDQEVFIRSNQQLRPGMFVSITITDATEYDLFASI